MNDQMSMFDDPPPAEQPPKKPRKPMRRKKRVAKATIDSKAAKHNISKKRRKRRTVKSAEPHKNYHTPEAYRLIGTLMNLELPLRNFVMEVTKALTK